MAGDNGTTYRYRPVPVQGLNGGVVQVTVGLGFSCAIKSDGSAVCWGANNIGQLGDGVTQYPIPNNDTSSGLPSTVPIKVALTGSVFELSANEAHACAAIADGTVLCWGAFNDEPPGGPPAALNPPQKIPIAIRTASSGAAHVLSSTMFGSCARLSNGTVVCWQGDLQPHPVQGVSNVVDISGSCSVNNVGQVQRWLDDLAAQSVSGLPSPALRVADTGTHTCAVLQGSSNQGSGPIYCWRDNSEGELGIGTIDQPDSNGAYPNHPPMKVIATDMGEGVQIAAGEGASCAIGANEELWCWGFNDGDGTGTPSPTPVRLTLR